MLLSSSPATVEVTFAQSADDNDKDAVLVARRDFDPRRNVFLTHARPKR